MQFNRKDLLSALRTIGGIVPKRTTMPILGCVEISHKGTLRATNIDQYLEIEVRQTAGAPYTRTFCTPVHALIKMLSAMTDLYVWFEADGDGKWTANKQEIEYLDPQDLPEPQAMLESAVEHAIPAGDIALMLDKCLWAASQLGGKELLSSIAWKGKDACATDGSRLSHVELLDHGLDVLLDTQLLKPIAKLVNASIPYGDLYVTVYGGNTRIRGVNWVTHMRNISGEYPRYHELFPTAPARIQLTFKRDDMLAKLKVVGTKLDKRTNKLVIDVTANTICCENEDGLKACVDADIQSSIDMPLPPFAVNWNYWKQAVESMSEDVLVDFEQALKPIIFRDNNYKHLLMPIQVAKPAKVVKEPKPPKVPKNKPNKKDAKVAEVSEKKSVAPVDTATDGTGICAPETVAHTWTKARIIPTRNGVVAVEVSDTSEDQPAAQTVTATASPSRPADSPCYHTSRTCKMAPCALAPREVA